jgi:Fe-S oxidoreductase
MWTATKCDLCGDCLVKCLYADYDRDRALSEIKALRNGEKAAILSTCITCCACREYCPTGADPYNLIVRSLEKFDVFSGAKKNLNNRDLAFEIAGEVVTGEPDKPVLALCVMERRIPQDTLNSRLFKGMGVIKGQDYFCLIDYEHVGKESPIERGAQRFIDKLAALNKDIIFLHDDCYAMVHTKIKDYGIAVPFRYMHLFEYLRDYLRNHHNSIRPLRKRVAYQRPCASRYTPEKDIFLAEIFELIEVERVPRKYDREAALCCGGPIVHARPALAREIQAKNIDDAITCGAEAIITLCPMCDRILRQPSAVRGLKKIFITDLVRMALGEKAFSE